MQSARQSPGDPGTSRVGAVRRREESDPLCCSSGMRSPPKRELRRRRAVVITGGLGELAPWLRGELSMDTAGDKEPILHNAQTP